MYTGTGYATVSNPIIPLFAVVICLQYIPFLVLCLYLTCRLLKYCCVQTICKKRTEINNTNEPAQPEQAPLIVPVTYTTVSIDDADNMNDLHADRVKEILAGTMISSMFLKQLKSINMHWPINVPNIAGNLTKIE